MEYAREVTELGAGEILLTSMDRDGTKSGFDIALTRGGRRRRAVSRSSPRAASATLDHLVAGVREGHASAVLAASIFHFGEYSIQQAKLHMARGGPSDASRRAGGGMSGFTLDDLAALITSRRGAAAANSYTKSLLDAGMPRIAKKFGEEAVETVIAALEDDKPR